MPKIKLIASLVVIAVAIAYVSNQLINESYICEGNVKVETSHSSSSKLTPDSESAYKLAFGFNWNNLSKKIKVSSIDVLTMVSFYVDVHDAALKDGKDPKSNISSNSMNVSFVGGHDSHANTTTVMITFDRKSKLIVIDMMDISRITKFTTQNNTKVIAQCTRTWF